MAKFLCIDTGAGTQDILFFDSEKSEYFKIVAPSPTRILADIISKTDGDLFVSGYEMGGGPVTMALKEKVKKRKIYITKKAAVTIHNDLEKVKKMGFNFIKQEEIPFRKDTFKIKLGDISWERIYNFIKSIDIQPPFDYLLIALQDHGKPNLEVSNKDFRHIIFKERLKERPFPEHFLFSKDEVPSYLTRMQAVLECVKSFPVDKVYIMDSGPAAILGASLDYRAKNFDIIITLDMATSHTLGALLVRNEICGFFEYHTKDITKAKLDELLFCLANGDISHKQILNDGGHGAYIKNAPGYSSIQAIIVTGPKRNILNNSKHKIQFGAPLGDNMMTGTCGLLEALNRKERLGLNLNDKM
jgi:uncharacterized protein (DUF1786 family)